MFNLSELKPDSNSIQYCPVENVIEISKVTVEHISYENVPTKKTADLKPFFDSFDSNEDAQFYSGWFMSDNFKGMPEVWTIL